MKQLVQAPQPELLGCFSSACFRVRRWREAGSESGLGAVELRLVQLCDTAASVCSAFIPR